MTDTATKAALAPARRRLAELMQEVNYGRIERLEVRDGNQSLTRRIFPRSRRLVDFRSNLA